MRELKQLLDQENQVKRIKDPRIKDPSINGPRVEDPVHGCSTSL